MLFDEKLIDAASLERELDDPRLRVVDATAFLRREVADGPYTVESGRASYDSAHIPGAVFADIPGDLSDLASPFRFTLPSPEHFARAIGALGVGDGHAGRRLRAGVADLGHPALVAVALFRLRRRAPPRRWPGGVARGGIRR